MINICFLAKVANIFGNCKHNPVPIVRGPESLNYWAGGMVGGSVLGALGTGPAGETGGMGRAVCSGVSVPCDEDFQFVIFVCNALSSTSSLDLVHIIATPLGAGLVLPLSVTHSVRHLCLPELPSGQVWHQPGSLVLFPH